MTDQPIHVGEQLTPEERATRNAGSIVWWERMLLFWTERLRLDPKDASSAHHVKECNRELHFLRTGEWKPL